MEWSDKERSLNCDMPSHRIASHCKTFVSHAVSGMLVRWYVRNGGDFQIAK